MKGGGMQVREESWVEDRGGAMKLDANCQFVLIQTLFVFFSKTKRE